MVLAENILYSLVLDVTVRSRVLITSESLRTVEFCRKVICFCLQSLIDFDLIDFLN